MSDAYFIEELGWEIEKKLNCKKIALWTDNDYKKLSQLILEDTSVSISPQTLKRLFGKVKYKEIYTPQPATTDALAMFLGYKDWLSFTNAKKNKTQFASKYKVVSKIFRFQVILSVLIGIIVFSFITVYIKYCDKNDDAIVFDAQNLSGPVPHTVSFHYDISGLQNKDAFISFDQFEAEDSLKMEKLDKSRNLINHCFESAGFYNVNIYVDGMVRSSVRVHVLSDGWASYYFNDDNFILRKFIFGLENKIKDIYKKDGLMHISQEEIKEQGFNQSTVYYLEYMNYKEFSVSADSCLLEIKYRNGPETGGISCYDTEFRIIGETGLASIMLVQKGCYRWSEVTVGEVHLNGKFNDLTKLSSDVTSWNIIKIKVNNGKALVVNGQDTIFQSSYLKPLGMIKGIRFVTKGSGSFDYVKLSDSRGEVKYEDNFDN
jgi:hypothetical protein